MRIAGGKNFEWVLVVAATALLLTACDDARNAMSDDPPSPTADSADAAEIAASFAEAYGDFDAEEAATYLAADANIVNLIGSVGAHQGVTGTPDEFRLLISLLRAAGYQQLLESCETTGDSRSGTLVHCPFAFHLFGSDRLGLGPYAGSSFDLTVLDGEILRAEASFDVDEFSTEIWEPFEAWVSEAHPEDAAVMYDDGTHTGMGLSEESVALWKRHVREYVQEMQP